MKQTLIRVARGFFSHDVGRSGAALAYYLLFALFPLLILIGFCLGALQLDLQSMVQRLSHVIPSEVVQLLLTWSMYLIPRAALCCPLRWCFRSGSPCAPPKS